MFTGLVAATGAIRAVSRTPQGLDLEVDLGQLAGTHRTGDSIALSGVCCTVIARVGAAARFQLTPETLARTWLGQVQPGRRLNLEAALRAGDPLGGHFVQGHVDDTAEVVAGVDPQQGGELVARLPAGLLRYCAVKGSLTLDGVSLTIARLRGDEVAIAVIPHTAQVTTLGSVRPGDRLHVEVDVLAKYVERLLQRE
jgi:riboflavin synthase alpha subunit